VDEPVAEHREPHREGDGHGEERRGPDQTPRRTALTAGVGSTWLGQRLLDPLTRPIPRALAFLPARLAHALSRTDRGALSRGPHGSRLLPPDADSPDAQRLQRQARRPEHELYAQRAQGNAERHAAQGRQPVAQIDAARSLKGHATVLVEGARLHEALDRDLSAGTQGGRAEEIGLEVPAGRAVAVDDEAVPESQSAEREPAVLGAGSKDGSTCAGDPSLTGRRRRDPEQEKRRHPEEGKSPLHDVFLLTVSGLVGCRRR